MWFDDDDVDDEYVGGEKTEGRNLNWKIPAASLVIPRSVKKEHNFRENFFDKQTENIILRRLVLVKNKIPISGKGTNNISGPRPRSILVLN